MELIVRQLGRRDYRSVWEAMRSFTYERDEGTLDEFWIVEHEPVYTLGKNGARAHIHDAADIPVVEIDRGGQVTYHGPGQLVVYTLLDIRRSKLGVRQLVTVLEESVIELLRGYGIQAQARSEAPGVYVDGDKIAALGLRVTRGRCFHGLALNIDVDLSPFDGIDPCGYEGLGVTRLANLVESTDTDTITERLVTILADRLGYETVSRS